jgi:hypothetical protein
MCGCLISKTSSPAPPAARAVPTLDWLQVNKQITVPDDCRTLVERATHADYLKDMARSLGKPWTDLWRELFDKAAINAQLAETSLIVWRRPYRDALVREWLPTRLGDGSVIVAVKNLLSPFTKEKLTALPIPGRWLRGLSPPEKPLDATDGQIRIGENSFRYGRLGLARTG